MVAERKPNFVGIGVPRGGTTWLHEFINSHPHAYTPRSRKEVHFFDRHYERGTDWYDKFFAEATVDHTALGEFTPHYLYNPDCAKRIYDFGIRRVLTTLRDPVDRTWSNYMFKRRQDHYKGSMSQFLHDYPEMISWGSYDDHLGLWLDKFGGGMNLLVFESVSKDPQALKDQLGMALEVDSELFNAELGAQRVNPTFVPKRQVLYNHTVKFNKWLVSHDLDKVANKLKQLPGVLAYLRSPDNSAPSLTASDEEIDILSELFQPSVRRLQSMVDVDLSMWKSAS